MPVLDKRLELGHLPTPLERADKLTDFLAGPRIFIKRDDATGLAGGGNKVRKLEYLAAAALEKGANCLVTVGGPQSNHARLTAAAAARLGLKCRLYLQGQAPRKLAGNILLDRLLGAELVFCGEAGYPEIYAQIDRDGARLREQGVEIYKIPVGGSTPVGALGYVRAVTEELVPQCRQAGLRPAAIIVAAGSGGTMAGLMLGLAVAGWEVPVCGYSVGPDARTLQREVADIHNGAARLLGVPHCIQPEQVCIDATPSGTGYGIATPQALEALALFARLEGILLDSVYTAKAAAGMIADIRRGRWKDEAVVFLHTGGWPALFAKDDVELWLREEGEQCR